MRSVLLKWIGDADALRHIDRLGVQEVPLALGYQWTRKDDLYISLVGELFDLMRASEAALPADWAQLGNALAQYAAPDRKIELNRVGISQAEAALFAAAAFYFGGFPASACVIARILLGSEQLEIEQACTHLLARPKQLHSLIIGDIKNALIAGDIGAINAIETNNAEAVRSALSSGPDEWIPRRLLQSLLAKFRMTNLRAVLPEGSSPFWNPLVASLVRRGTWDFFPSQIAAIERGLLTRSETFSLQMPTGAGKTTLCETLLFYHLSARPTEAAVLLVPYRSLASELRGTLVRNLNKMGISARCSYGGTVPSGEEVRAFDDTRALIATPETLSGLLSANPSFAQRISLVICDEGHLLAAPSRGVGLELLLARMKTRPAGVQRYVFVSAIVPNIEEINQWLGGTEDSVVRSDYRPAIAEFSVLRPIGEGPNRPWDLEMHPHEDEPIRYRIERFLRRDDFQFVNPITDRFNKYPYNSFSCLAIASARKALPMGSVVVFSANKRGDQGAVGLARQLVKQVKANLPLPKPLDFGKVATITLAAEYLESEFGKDWIGTETLKAGAILHHGDIPQETREVLEGLLRRREIAFGICTSTLAEGVNLPIRTLVLYSVQRVGERGARENLLTRDIKNLVGRAGRAGSNTRGFVICVNPDQWPMVAPVAQQAAGEAVVGALRSLIENVRGQLALHNIELTNGLLEQSSAVHSLVDGIDATLLDLAAVELGEEELLRLATNLADQTFASQQTDEASRQLLRSIFSLRARQIFALRTNGRLNWVKETGTRVRIVTLVESDLLPRRAKWDDITDPLEESFLNSVLAWAWNQIDLQEAAKEAYRLEPEVDVKTFRDPFFSLVKLWLSGAKFVEIAKGANLPVDDLLGVHTKVISFGLQTIVEQGLAVLEKLLQEKGEAISDSAKRFSEHLRFGVPTIAGCTLAAGGVTHRLAFVELGKAIESLGVKVDDRRQVFKVAQGSLETYKDQWQAQLGTLVFERTLRDLAAETGRTPDEE